MQLKAWFPNRKPQSTARCRLVCLPYAGGNAAIYRTWQARLPGIEVCAAELPGRWGRVREKPYESIPNIVTDLHEALAQLPPLPTAFFGYSFGTVVAYEMARHSQVAPIHLFAGASRSPNTRERIVVSNLSNEQIVTFLANNYGAPIPPALLADPEMSELILRSTRADLLCLENYEKGSPPPLACPITVFAGEEDHRASPADLQSWSVLTNGVFDLHALPGGHFFIHQQEGTMLEIIGAKLAELQ